MLLSALCALVSLAGPDKLVVKDLKVGKGAVAEVGDTIVVDYTGTLSDGKEFDSSRKSAPFSFTLGAKSVIPGWEQGLPGMRVGGKRSLTIPSDLAYGDAGSPPIPPKATLKFEVELLYVEKKGATPKVEFTVKQKGTGPDSAVGDTIFVHCRGKFLNGVEFWNSYDDKKPLEVQIGTTRLIAGFTQGVTGMKLGEKRVVTIPSALAYGAKGAGNAIPPNMPLQFELERVAKP